jgi:hypothetical protein
MQVETNLEAPSWLTNGSTLIQDDTLISEANKLTNPEEGLDLEKKAEEDLKNDVVLDEEGKEIKPQNIEDQVNTTPNIAENIIDVFEDLRNNKEYNFGFYENKKIETKEDIAEFIQINADAKYESAIKNIDTQWYNSKSPVFQQFAQMAELAGDDPNKLYSLIETQKVIEDYQNFDTREIDQAALIVENWLKLKNEPIEVIEQEIEDLKQRELISERADKYKPLLVAHFEKEKENKILQEQQNISTFYKAVEENQKNVVTFLSNKDIDGMKWKDEDKDIVFDNLSYNTEIQGFPIFKKIEDLQAAGKFDLLGKIILMAENPERFDELYVSRVKTTVARDLKGKIRFANDNTSDIPDVDSKKIIKKVEGDDEFVPYTFK